MSEIRKVTVTLYPSPRGEELGMWSILKSWRNTAAVYDIQTGERIDPPLIYEDVDTGRHFLPRELIWEALWIWDRNA